MVESPDVVPEGLEDLGRQHCFDTFPEELDKITAGSDPFTPFTGIFNEGQG